MFEVDPLLKEFNDIKGTIVDRIAMDRMFSQREIETVIWRYNLSWLDDMVWKVVDVAKNAGIKRYVVRVCVELFPEEEHHDDRGEHRE